MNQNNCNKEGVSIIIPCYNSEEFLPRLFGCLIKQIFKQLHVIIVNDGSTDATDTIILNYKKVIIDAGMRFTYIKQDNQGQATAINNGLKVVDTVYFTWLDSDDWVEPNHIEHLVKAISESGKMWISCCGVKEDVHNPQKVLGNLGIRSSKESSFYKDLLYHRANCTPGLYLVRTEAFFIANGGRSIICNKPYCRGQNLQLLLPMAIKYNEPLYLDEILLHYTVREESSSHMVQSECSNMMQYIEHVQLLKKDIIMNNINLDENQKNSVINALDNFEQLWKLKSLMKYDKEIASPYVSFILGKPINKYLGDRTVRIWGINAIGCFIRDILSMLYPQIEFGYVESDRNKCVEDVVYKDDIDPSKDYIILLLDYHDEIVKTLRQKGYLQKKDYVYYQELMY